MKLTRKQLDKKKESIMKWRKAHPRRFMLAKRRARFNSRYGRMFSSKEELFEVVSSRKGRSCEICGKKSKKSLHLDHCHKTQKFRGFLCMRCNSMIGFAKDDVRILKSAIKYLS